MKTVQEIITELGGPSKLALIFGVSRDTASKMCQRGVIPVWYWRRLIESCRKARISDVNYKNLVELHSNE
jgi:hypothetical protein